MNQPTGSLGERRSRLAAAREALVGMSDVLHQASGPELAELLGEVDAVAAQASAARVAVTVEAVSRGEVARAGANVHTWVREHAPSLCQGGAGDVARVATAVVPAGPAWRPEGGVVDPDSPVGIVWAGVEQGLVSAGLATAVLRELDRLTPLLRDETLPTVTRGLLELGVLWGPGVMRRLRPRMVAQFGHVGALEGLQERLVSAARLSAPFVESGDLTQYELWMTPEQAASLEAAIGPLSTPAPNDETGERDLRPSGQRRVEALAEVCRRSSALDAEERGGADGAAGSWAALHVSISLGDLQAGTGCGEVLGSTSTGTLLSPQVLRRVACEAELVPYVLGTAGEELDAGRAVRLFTRAQRRALWRRDRGCTFPGCTAPAAWSRAHHVRHWADGGLSDVDNAALLCQRHHTHVHTRRLWATVREGPDERGRFVAWDLHEGSYDRHLERLRSQEGAADPPALTPERWRALLAALHGDDPDEQRWAGYELDDALPDPWWEDQPSAREIWTPQVIAELEAASHAA